MKSRRSILQIDRQGEDGSNSIWGCFAGAMGSMFILTGGTCVYLGFAGNWIVVGLVGLGMMAIGWLMIATAK